MPDTQTVPSAAERTKELTDRLEAGIKDLLQSDKYRDYLKSMSHFHNYSRRNIMLIHVQMPNATRVASFRLWDEQFNRHVKKGEKSIRIFAPIANKNPEKKLMEKLDPETGAPLLDSNGKVIMEEMTALSSGPRFKLVPVFDVSQTFGDPLPELAENLTGNVAHYEAFMAALEKVSPLPIIFEPLADGNDGYCRFGDKIGIRKGMSEIQTISAVVHEITHARLHDKGIVAEADDKSKNVKELEAESISYVVCQHYGIETGANSFGYLASYSDSDMTDFKASLDTIRKEANGLINAIDDSLKLICAERGIDLTAQEPEAAAPAPAVDTPAEPEYATVTRTENIAGVEFTVSDVTPGSLVPEQTAEAEKPARTPTALQQRGIELAKECEKLPLQDRMNIIAETFGCKTASIKTSPCTGKWRGTSDISLVFDSGTSIFIGNRRTPQAKTAKVQNECVNGVLATYHPEIVSEAKALAAATLIKREAEDNAVASEKGLKPYTFLNVELNDGSDNLSGGHIGWYYVTIAVDDKIRAFMETGLNYDIQAGKLSEHISSRNYYAAGALKDEDVDFVFNNVGFASDKSLYSLHLSDEARERAEKMLEQRQSAELPAPEAEADYEITYWQMGTGTLALHYFDENDGRHGEYEELARIDPDRTVTFTDATMPDVVRERITEYARTADIPNMAAETAAKAPSHDMEPEEFMPDPAIGISEMNLYGYMEEDMLPLTTERAIELFEQDMTIYMLYDDNTEAMVFDKDEIITYGAEGIFGVPRGEWQASDMYKDMAQAAEAPASEHADTFSIYQLGRSEELRYHRFASLAQLEKDNLAVDRGNYDLVYTAPLPPTETLNDIYDRFNLDRPKDFTGHSLSVSDVVVVERDGTTGAYYVDNFGFTRLPEFTELPRQPEVAANVAPPSVYRESLAYAREHDEIEAFIADRTLNEKCRDEIHAAINESRYDSHFYKMKDAVKQVVDEFGSERVELIMAKIVQGANWDGRYSRQNKDWAAGFEIPQSMKDVYSNTHPCLLDGFLDKVREKPSILETLKANAEKSRNQAEAKPDPKKSKEQEI